MDDVLVFDFINLLQPNIISTTNHGGHLRENDTYNQANLQARQVYIETRPLEAVGYIGMRQVPQ